MHSDHTSPRQSRGRQRKSYRVGEEYSFLDEDDDECAPSRASGQDFNEGGDEDGDDFMPDAQDDEPEEDLGDHEVDDEEDEDVEEEEEMEDSDDEFGGPRRRGVRGSNAILVAPTTPMIQRHKQPTDNVPSPITFAKGAGIKLREVDGENKLRTRGIPDFDKVGGHEPRLKNLFGPDGQHVRPVLASRDYWFPQETFPIRNCAQIKPNDADFGSLRRSFFETHGSREKENRVLRTWYVDTGRAAFAAAQYTQNLSSDEAKVYLRNAGPETLNLLSGPVNAHRVYTLAKGSYLNIADPFPEDQNRKGWLFNLGSRVQDSQWATNEDSSTQYLAIAVEQKPTGESQPKPMELPKAPAFNATPPYPASIQIWSFEATKDGELDSSKHPKLVLVVCADWGAPKQLRWCPVGATDKTQNSDDEQERNIGMLASIWSDGRVRVLDLYAPTQKPDIDSPTYLYISRAAFEVSLPQTIPSCLHWLSGTTIAVASAAGTVGIWSLTRPNTLAPPNATNHNPRPWSYQQLADTYILTISSAWPSNPQYLSITTADGFARLFDIRNPKADQAASIRGRTLCLTQAWHEHTQSFVMPDEHYILRHTPLRRYYHNLYSMRIENSITRVATSPVHPGVLVGGTDGDVQTTNPLGRIVNYKNMPWQQRWFVHEWRGPMERMLVKPMEGASVRMLEDGLIEHPRNTSEAIGQDNSASDPISEPKKVPQDILSKPLVRITEGYKAIQQGITLGAASKKKVHSEIGRSISIFEKQSAITALAWNPNLKYGTWAVAGMGSGLLRVEDVGISGKK